MRVMILKDLNDPSKYVLRKRTQTGPNFICYAPEGVPIEALDIVDDIDEFTGEIRGKKAVVNQAKLAQYEADNAAAEQARLNDNLQRQTKIQALKQSGSQEIKDLLDILGL